MGQQDNGTLLTSPWIMVMSPWHRFTSKPLQKKGQRTPEIEGKYGYFFLLSPPCVDFFHIAGAFSTNVSKRKWRNDTTKHPTWAQKVCHQGVKTSYMRLVTGGDMERPQTWSKPNPPWRKEDVWCLQKHHPLTYNSTGRGTMGLFHKNYCMNQHNTGNKYLAGIKVVQKTYFGSMPLSSVVINQQVVLNPIHIGLENCIKSRLSIHGPALIGL